MGLFRVDGRPPSVPIWKLSQCHNCGISWVRESSRPPTMALALVAKA